MDERVYEPDIDDEDFDDDDVEDFDDDDFDDEMEDDGLESDDDDMESDGDDTSEDSGDSDSGPSDSSETPVAQEVSPAVQQVVQHRAVLTNIKDYFVTSSDEETDTVSITATAEQIIAALEWSLRPESARVGRKRALTPEEREERKRIQAEAAKARNERIKEADDKLSKVTRRLLKSAEYGPQLRDPEAPAVVAWFNDPNIVDQEGDNAGKMRVKFTQDGYPIPRVKDLSKEHSVTAETIDGVPLASIQFRVALANYVIEKDSRAYVLADDDDDDDV